MSFDISLVPAGQTIEISIPAPSTELTDFSFLINLSGASGVTDFDCAAVFTELGANSKKIAVEIGSSGVQCYGEIEQWGTNAQLHVKIPTRVTTAPTVLRFHYDSTQIDNVTYIGDTGSTPAQAVWDSNFAAVYHMSQDPSVGGACILDSTSNVNHGTPTGMVSGNLVDGLIGKALDFNGSEYITIPNDTSMNGSTLTIECLMRFDVNADTNQVFISKKDTIWNQASGYYVSRSPNTTTIQGVGSGATAAQVSVGANDDAFYTYANIYNGTTFSVYKSGTSNGSGTVQALVNNTDNLVLGRLGYGVEPVFAIIGEVRISNIVRSVDWIADTDLSLTDALATFSVAVSPASSSAGSSGGQPVVLPTVRTVINLPYSLTDSIRVLVNMLYGIKLSTIVNLRYGDLTELRKIVNLKYGDMDLIRRLIDIAYGDLSSLRNLVSIDYDLQYQVRALVNMPYHIIQEQLRNLVDLDYDLLQYDNVKNLVNIIYAISSGVAIEETTTLSITNEHGYTLNPFHLNIEKDEGDPCIRIEIRSNDQNDYEENPETTEIQVTVNSDTYVVLVDEREVSSQISEDGTEYIDVYTLKMASPCLLLDAPHSDLLTEELTGMASTIAAYVAGTVSAFSGYGIEWSLLDWYIKPGVFSVNNATPISILEQLASAAGGIRQSKKDGTLELRKEYPVNIPDYDTETPAVYLTDQDNFYSVNSITERYDDYNNFLVGNIEQSTGGLEVKYENISSTKREVRVFQIPWDEDDTITLNTSGGSHVEVYAYGVENLLIEDEEVEIVDGEGTTTSPIYEITKYDYLEEELGTITIFEDKKIQTATAENSIVKISYYTKFWKFIVIDEKIENVQFWPEIS